MSHQNYLRNVKRLPQSSTSKSKGVELFTACFSPKKIELERKFVYLIFIHNKMGSGVSYSWRRIWAHFVESLCSLLLLCFTRVDRCRLPAIMKQFQFSDHKIIQWLKLSLPPPHPHFTWAFCSVLKYNIFFGI